MPEGMINIAEVLAHTEGAQIPEVALDPPKPEYEGRERVRLRPHEMAQRRMEMAALFAEGKHLKTIGKIFHLNPSTVGDEIHKLIAEYQEAAKASIAHKIAREEALLYMIQLEAIEAWFESKQGKIINTAKRAQELKSVGLAFGRGRKSPNQVSERMTDARIRAQFDAAFEIPDTQDESQMIEKSDKDESTTRTETSPGDPRFLQIILECSDRRSKLYNLYPKDGQGQGLTDDEVLTMTPQGRMSALRGFLDKARMKRAAQLATAEAGRNATVEAMNQKALAEPVPSIFETQAKKIVEAQAVPIQQPQQSSDLGGLWDATA